MKINQDYLKSKSNHLVRKHKNTITAIVNLLGLIFLSYELITDAISFSEFAAYVAVLGTLSVTIVGLLSPDGNTSPNTTKP